jgi:hopanoid biosynthesis associated protein HpnK
VIRLIVNADDFGLTSGVNRAVVELHAARVLTSATLMAQAAATEEAAQMARNLPSLGVGCHVVLMDGAPALTAREVPTLVDRKTGSLHATTGAFLRRLFTMRIRAREIEAEAAAQIAHLQSYGLRLTHIDTHKHMHMFPGVLRPVLRAARKAGIRAVRNPFEALWSLNATTNAPEKRRAQVVLLRRLEPAFRRIVAEEGFTTTDGAIGVLATGTIDIACLKAMLSAMPDGTFELVSHPGYRDADLERANTRLLSSREIERNALMALRDLRGVEFISYSRLNPVFDSASKS